MKSHAASRDDRPITDSSISTLLKRYNLRPRKELGQHFLAAPGVLSKITDAANISPESIVLEIGPGLGTLTRFLARTARLVFAVELDPAMFNLLQHELADLSNVRLIHQDILKIDPAVLVASSANQDSFDEVCPYIVVANLPYYITSAAIRHLLEARVPPNRLVLTVQQEVARRIVARPGDMSLLAVSVQFYGTPRIVANIPPGAFVPPPSVNSAVLRVDTHPTPVFDVPDRHTFFRVVRAGFSQKRKQLKNSLAAGLNLDGDPVISAMRRAEIEPQRRAQTLSLEEWVRLSWELAEILP